jgi:hypothetical protein
MSSLFNPLHKIGGTEFADIRLTGSPSGLMSFDLDVTVSYSGFSPPQFLSTRIDTLSASTGVSFTLQSAGGLPVTVAVSADGGDTIACQTSFYTALPPST